MGGEIYENKMVINKIIEKHPKGIGKT